MNETISALEKERDGVRQKERDLTRKIKELRTVGNAGSKRSNFHKKALIKALIMLEISDQDISALIGISEKRIAVFRGRANSLRSSCETDMEFLESWSPL